MTKVVHINDCAFVGETLLKYLPDGIEKQHIKRSRGMWSKTFGVAYKILRSKGDVYHAHYILQDCYIASRLRKKPLIGHAHGDDLRRSLRNPVYRRIIKHNSKHCSKILVSTPDLLRTGRQYRNDASYFPNPVDTEFFYPKPAAARDHKVILIAECDWDVKGTDIAIKALSKIKDEVEVRVISNGVHFDKTIDLARHLGLHLKTLPKAPHEKINEYIWDSDLVIDRFVLDSLGMVSLEGIACGRPVVTYVSSEYEEYKDFPLKDVKEEEGIISAITDSSDKFWRQEYAYLEKNHLPSAVIPKLLEIYEEVIRD